LTYTAAFYITEIDPNFGVSRKRPTFSPKIGQNDHKMVKTAGLWSKWPKIGQNGRKLVKMAEKH
jgi:hypothetical protein